MPEKLVLVDGHALAYRAFFALPVGSFSTSKGELTNAVYGFAAMLLRALEVERPDYIAVTFDAPGETFRHREFEEYKAQRGPMPDELQDQMGRIREIVRGFNIPIFELEGYEADDLIGTLASQAGMQGVETMIVTGDYDTFQLVSPQVKVLTTVGRQAFANAQVFDEEAIRERYGIEPARLVDYKALVGDPSDNIPGIVGIGKKYATALIQQYGTVEKIYEHLEEVQPPRARSALEGRQDEALLNKRLVTIRTDAPVELGLEACRTSDFDPQEVLRLMRELEFRSLAERLPALSRDGAGPPDPAAVGERAAVSHHVVADRKGLGRLIELLSKADHITLDVETTSTDPMEAELVGIALGVGPEEGYYVPVGHLGQGSERQLPLEEVLDGLRPVLEDSAVPKWAHNAIYDLGVLSRHGVSVRGLAFDTMIAAFLVDPSGRGYGLKDLAWKRLGVEVTPISELIGSGRTEITMAEVPIDRAAPYAAADVVFTDRLASEFAGELEEKALWDLFVDVEVPLIPVLLEMELAGVAVDASYLSELSREMHLRLSEVEEEIHDMAGHPFNVASSPQLQTVLFEELGLPPQKRTKTGYSTSADVLETLRPLHPIIALIEEQRSISKLKSTYVDALPLLVNSRSGRIHTSYHQTGAVTGRISSSRPNLQNIPVRTDPGRRVRKAFVAPEGMRLLTGDYSQVELRILAHVSQDPGLLEAFARGEDVHASTAASLYEVGLDAVTGDMRRVAKTINFGLIYGMGEYGLAERTGLSREQAREFIANYFARFPKVKTYIDDTVRMAKEEGYVSTVLGHRRYFPELRSGVRVHQGIRRAAERMAINMPIQGSAADIIKLAMIRLHASLADENREARLILQVHDELVLEVPEQEVESAAALVREVMEGAYALEPALAVELSVGENWGEMAPLAF